MKLNFLNDMLWIIRCYSQLEILFWDFSFLSFGGNLDSRTEPVNWRPLPLLFWSLALPPPLHRSLHCIEISSPHSLNCSEEWRGGDNDQENRGGPPVSQLCSRMCIKLVATYCRRNVQVYLLLFDRRSWVRRCNCRSRFGIYLFYFNLEFRLCV